MVVGLRTTYSTALCRAPCSCTVTRTTVVGGKRHLRLRFVLPFKFVLPTEKVSTPSVLAVLVF